MANAGTLTVTLQAVSQKFTAGMNKAAGSLKMFRGAIGPVQAAIGGLSAGLLAARFTKVAGDLDMLADSAQSLGVSIKDLSSLQYAGVVKGIANDQLSGALDRLNRATVLAADGNKRYGASFSQLGINTSSFLKLDAEQKLFAVADALQGIDDPARRSAIALRLLGNNSADMMDLLSGGSSGIKALQNEANSLGISVGSSAADLGKFNEELAKLGSMWKAAEMQIVIALAPGVMDALGLIRDVGAMANGGEVSKATGSGAKGGERLNWWAEQSKNSLNSAVPFLGTASSWLGNQWAGDKTAGALTPEEQAKADARMKRNQSPVAEAAFAKQIENEQTRVAVANMLGGAFDKLKGRAAGMLTNAQQMGKGAGSQMGWLGGAYMTAQRMQQQGAANQRERASSLFEHFKGRGMGENNLLKRGTREAWMAERKSDKDREQINLLKGIENACKELAKKGVTVAMLD